MAKKSKKNVIQVGVRPEDKATLTLTIHPGGLEQLEFAAETTPLDAQKLSGRASRNPQRRKHVLADYDAKARLLRTYPITTTLNSPYLFSPKYGAPILAVEDQPPISEQLDRDNGLPFQSLPTGFVRDPFDGLGLVYPLRFIMEVFDDLDGLKGVILCNDTTLSMAEGFVRLPVAHFDKVRRAINRAHNAALGFAAEDKEAYIRAELLTPLLEGAVDGAFRKDVSVLKTRLNDALTKPGNRQSRTANAKAAVRTVRQAAKDLATEDPVELYELNREIELITLIDLVSRFSEKIGKNLSEGHWQKFLSANPFILRLAFGFPITIFGEQVSVGGGKFDNSGGKLADYVIRSGLLGNLSIIEIKKPSTALLEGKPYRGDVYPPSKELSGSVTQVLDQRWRLQQEINDKKSNSGIYDVFAYSVQCIVIAGVTPDDNSRRKSLEIYRSNLRDVIVITFDELLSKLKALEEFFSKNNSSVNIAPTLLGEEEERDRDEDLVVDLNEDLEAEELGDDD